MRYSPRPRFLPAALVVGLLVVILIALAGCFLQGGGGVYSDGPLPSDTTVTVGGTFTYRAYYSCEGGCGGHLAYQWQKDGVDLVDSVLVDQDPVRFTGILGATSDRLQLFNIQMADSGIYSVTINDSLYHGSAHLAVTLAAP